MALSKKRIETITQLLGNEERDSLFKVSPKGENDTFSTSGLNAFLYFGLNVIESAPSVFPWYDPITLCAKTSTITMCQYLLNIESVHLLAPHMQFN